MAAASAAANAALLGIHLSAIGKEAKLRAAYRAAAAAAHPDALGGSTEAFQAVGRAYNELQQHAKEEQWGTSNSAYGAHARPAPQKLAWNGT